MKRRTIRFLLTNILFFTTFCGFSQYVTPGSGKCFHISDLADSAGQEVITLQDGICSVYQAITLSTADSLLLDADVKSIRFYGAAGLQINGTMLCAHRNDTLTVEGVADSSGQTFEWRFTDAPASRIAHLHFINGNSIVLNNSNITFDSCQFNGFAAQVIRYMQSNPVIRRCHFYDNRMEAIQSAANTKGSPVITDNLFERNVTSNANRPQLNMGPGDNDSILIIGNRIVGVSSMSGGIAIADMLGIGQTKVRLQDNRIEHNRYGFTQQGYHINTLILHNDFADNNLETNPMNGGSGISIFGYDTTCCARIRQNLIHGNLWGITAIYHHQTDLGTSEDFGGNVFYDNGNAGSLYALYNNSVHEINAVGNYWGGNDSAFVASVIYHEEDAPELGFVNYLPFNSLHPEMTGCTVQLANTGGDNYLLVAEISAQERTARCKKQLADDNISDIFPETPLGVTFRIQESRLHSGSDTLTCMLYTPHGDSTQWMVIAYTDIRVEETAQTLVKCYPNPLSAGETLQVENPTSGKTNFTVYNTAGRIITQGERAEAVIRIATGDWKPGLYLIRFQQGDRRLNGKIVVK